jgi:mRNA-degrading endonuclease RelE of RelBE toxin-antitoxin system
MAYIHPILDSNSKDSHQTSPGYVLTFTRLSNRDVNNYGYKDLKGKQAEDISKETRTPLVVINDAVAVNVSYSKSNPTPTLNCVLKQGDLNYLTAIHPGDYVIVNMINDQNKVIDIRNRALGLENINNKDDGFKGLFKILDVNMNLSISGMGEKNYYVQITARGFDEFNNILYFNPALPAEMEKSKGVLFLNSFNGFTDILLNKDRNNVQDLVKTVIQRTIGQGMAALDKSDTNLNQIPAYAIPNQIAKLLGIKNARNISDINKYYLGVWDSVNGFVSFFKEYEEPEKKSDSKKESNPKTFFKTKTELQGARQVSFEDFQTVKVWSLLQDYSNPVINESYTCYRLCPDGRVYPSVIVRQKPFNTRNYEEKGPVSVHTKFLDLPRWKISGNLITNLSIGRSDQGRINFVQVFSRSLSIDSNFDAALQIQNGNYVEDSLDVLRHGRKPYIVTCNYNPPSTKDGMVYKAREWAYLMADWLFNGHLKLNGTIQTVGIEEPICVGDNLEFDNVVYHIETITHSINISPDGVKTFRTNLSLSMGMDDNSNKQGPIYGEMDHTDSFSKRKEDYKREKVLPGFSDSQDITTPDRVNGEEIKNTPEKTFTDPKVHQNIKGNKK